MFLQDGLQNSQSRLPDKTALICGPQRLSYTCVDSMADRMANGLIAHGIHRGDRVAMVLPNSVEAVVCIFAILKAGAVLVPIHPGTRQEKLFGILEDSGARVLVTDHATAMRARKTNVFDSCPDLELLIVTESPGDAAEEREIRFNEIQRNFPAVRPQVSAVESDVACLIYTSGSTGKPKGVVCDHASAVFVANSVMEYLANREDDIVLSALPLSYSYGLYQTFMTFTFGGTLVLETSFAYPIEFLRRIEQERVTGFPGVPTLFAALLKTDFSAFDLSSLRFCTNAAAALPVCHVTRFQERLPNVQLFSMYGNTETKRSLYLPPEQLAARPDSSGIAIPGTEVWIEDEDGRRVGPHVVGELIVRGRNVMRGYWHSPEATAKKFQDTPVPGERIYRTGDLFRMDEDGFMYFVARKDDMINTGGKKVAPTEVENALHRCPGVLEAAVVAVPDEMLGQAIKAVLVVESQGITPREILSHCRVWLEEGLLPKHFEFRTALPKTQSGKVLKSALV